MTTYLTQKSLVDRSTDFPGRIRKDTERLLNLLDVRFKGSRLRFFLRARLRMIVELWEDKGMHIYARLFTWSLLFLFFFFRYRWIVYMVERSFTRNLNSCQWYFRWVGWCVSWGWYACVGRLDDSYLPHVKSIWRMKEKREKKVEIYAAFFFYKKKKDHPDFDLPSRVYAAIGIQKSSATHSVTHEACRTYIKKTRTGP